MSSVLLSPELQGLLSLQGPSSLPFTSLQSLKLQQKNLTTIPSDIGLLTSLTELDLANNLLTSIPSDVGKLTNLTMLNLMGNQLSHLPEEIGNLVQLKNLGLKSNQLTSIPKQIGNLTNLVGLFLTDNKIQAFPDEIGNLISLKKLQSADNHLTDLPTSMQKMTSLELFRLAGNKFSVIPQALLVIPKLSWTSLANNPISLDNTLHVDLPKLSINGTEIVIDYNSMLGAGASGKVYRSKYQDKEVAVKLFNGEVSPDGRSEDELSVSIVLNHIGIPQVLALIVDGSRTVGTVMELVQAEALGDRPDFTSVLRCRYPAGTTYSSSFVKNVSLDLARACAYLHSLGICHGDIYAHNLLVNPEGHAKLCDFGASFFYSPNSPIGFEKIEVQAYGLLIRDLSVRVDDENMRTKLQKVFELCTLDVPANRPSFKEIEVMLNE